MKLATEKGKIKKALEWVDDARIIFGMKGYIEQYDPKDKMAENYMPQKARKIDVAREKEVIVKAVEASNDKGFLGGIKWFILLYDTDDTYRDLITAPVASWEMSMPFGRKFIRKQISEYLDRDMDDEEGYTIEEVKEHIKQHSAERKKFWDAI